MFTMMFKPIRKIISKAGILHFKRWQVISVPFLGSIYIHAIYQHDGDTHMHDHPWDFMSFILKGSYKEQTIDGIEERKRFSFKKVKAEYLHKIIELGRSPTITLVITGPRRRSWGYKVREEWIDNIEYTKNKSDYKWL